MYQLDALEEALGIRGGKVLLEGACVHVHVCALWMCMCVHVYVLCMCEGRSLSTHSTHIGISPMRVPLVKVSEFLRFKKYWYQ